MPLGMRRWYHRLLAWTANLRFGRPSRHLVVIGVTGTDGKTTTAVMIADLLQAAGKKVGLSSSIWWQIGEKRWLNESHMTMPGRFALQRLLRQMVTAGCQYAVIEVSSEGLAQHRHIGVDFDIAVVTNLTPEHLEAHGSWNRYRSTKGLLFHQIIRSGDKHRTGLNQKRTTVVNLDDPSAEYFSQFWAEQHLGVSLHPQPKIPAVMNSKFSVLTATNLRPTPTGSEFIVDGQRLQLHLAGEFNVANALEAIAVARACGVSWDVVASTLPQMTTIPGRVQEIPTGRSWRVVIDYAVTPNALEKLYQTLQTQGAKRLIAVFGAAGGGRDRWKRPELGKIAARYCQQIILTTDDPYDEDPRQIAEAIKRGMVAAQAQAVKIILDRRQAIQRAINLAQAGDVVAVTGMGAETSMMVKGKKVNWNDAATAQQLIQGLRP